MSLREDFETAINREKPNRTPVVLWSKGPFIPEVSGIDVDTYYTERDIAMQAQIAVQERFPEAMMWPGIWPDIGPVVEAAAFGSPLQRLPGKSPYARPAVHSIKEAARLRPVDPWKAELMADMLRGWQYLLDHVPKNYIDDYGYVAGCANTFGPMETAGLVLGHEPLYLAMYDEPDLVHQMLAVLTETIIAWLQAQEQVTGPLKRISLTDHLAGQLPRAFIEEFYAPYLTDICAAFPSAAILYHNEDNVEHILDLIPAMGFSIFHFGIAVDTVVKHLGGRISLMGAVHSQNTLLWGTAADVYQESIDQIKAAAPYGGFLLSVRGGFAPGTPLAHIDAMLAASRDYPL